MIRLPQAFRLIPVAALLSACAVAGAPPPAGPRPAPGVATSRTGVVKGTGIVAARTLQVEAGLSGMRCDARDRRSYGETLVRLGVGHATELRAGIPSYLVTHTPAATHEGAGDASVAIKHRFRAAAAWRPALSLIVGATLPTGAEAMSAGDVQPEAGVSADWRLPHGLWITGMGAHRAAIAAGDRFGQNTLGGALRRELPRGAGMQVEYSRVSTTRAGSVPAAQLRGTGTLRLTPELQLDGWAGRTTQHGFGSEAAFGVGITRRW